MNHAAAYAVRAAAFLAHQPRRQATAAAIADALGLPRNYLSKVLHVMAQAGLLASTRGPHGGFKLHRAPEQLTLAQLTGPFRHENPSPDWWQGVTNQMSSFLNDTTLQMLLDDNSLPIAGGIHVDTRRAR